MLNFIILFTVGIISLCILFSTLIIFPRVFPMVNAIYIVATMSVILFLQTRLEKNTEESERKVNSQRLKYISIFNIILSFFVVVVLIFKMFQKLPDTIKPNSWAF